MAVVLAACSSTDSATGVAEPNPDDTTTTTALIAGGVGAGMEGTPTSDPSADDTVDVDTTSQQPSGDAAETPDNADCIVGEWVLDAPRFVADAAAVQGEPMTYSSGTYSYTFAEDGTFTTAVNLAYYIDGESGPMLTESSGTMQGTWLVPDLSADDVATVLGLEEPGELPYILIETTALSIAQAGTVRGQTVPFGVVDDPTQGLNGAGPFECTSGTMTVRATTPLAIDHVLNRR